MAQPPHHAAPDDEWETVEATTAPGVAAPDDWEDVDGGPETPTNWMGGLAGLAGAGAAAVPLLKAGAERIATSPAIAALIGKASGKIGALNPLYQGYEVVTGRKGLGAALKDGAIAEAGRRAVGAIPNVAARVATGLGAEGVAGMAAPVAVPLAGGLAGVAGSAGFLAALQHDANRTVPMDYTKRNLTEDIARVLGGSGATDAQMDDPNHPAFRPDDSATVSAGEPGGLTAALVRLLRGGA